MAPDHLTEGELSHLLKGGVENLPDLREWSERRPEVFAKVVAEFRRRQFQSHLFWGGVIAAGSLVLFAAGYWNAIWIIPVAFVAAFAAVPWAMKTLDNGVTPFCQEILRWRAPHMIPWFIEQLPIPGLNSGWEERCGGARRALLDTRPDWPPFEGLSKVHRSRLSAYVEGAQTSHRAKPEDHELARELQRKYELG